MDIVTREINLDVPDQFEQWKTFLESLGIANFSGDEIDPLDYTIGLFDGDQLVGTGSYSGNILKYIGVSHQHSEDGVYFNKVVSNLLTNLGQHGVFHVFVFTKPMYAKSFEHVGFKELVQSDDTAFLETGDYSITDYLESLPKVNKSENNAGIVMNANPFTDGHRYLIEQASQASDNVYVFVVSTDKSLFTSSERLNLVKAGVSDLKNVMVVPGGDYLVSYATFPSYFLKAQADKVRYQTTIDALIFKDWIAKHLGINARFLGTEPNSKTTAIYNQILEKILPPQVEVKVIKRDQNDGKVISARTVRQAIKDNQISSIKNIVPKTTYQFIVDHKDDLQERIKKGMKISGN
ncbi:[citrate (pro-3S)-lyase] ligase [Fructilactobacillus fructivorans]|uniref:[citrate (pro-3S)-lyase] ligase n=1 Tax=Fructilactobacillus fructivorans TaxID=1614 RepID=UPI00070FAE85|nr:[citrate (pro-3S)-lyase] ligase [Fructilactobacillus fructivorans]KRN39625.1 [citrate (pro-3S)-lyase] ligase [Fructilactobacillus fructivorans]